MSLTRSEWSAQTKLDKAAAEMIDGWTGVRMENGELWGNPPGGGRRPLKHYTRDVGRATILARTAARKNGRWRIDLEINNDDFVVYVVDEEGEIVRQWSGDGVASVAESLTEAAVYLISGVEFE